MNEIFLNGILHLFAIFAAHGKLRREAAQEVIDRYLKQTLGVIANSVYCDLFDEFLNLHVSQEDPEWSWQQARILTESLRSKLQLADQYLLLARLMELTRILDQQDIYNEPLQQTAGLLAISKDTFGGLYQLVFRPDSPFEQSNNYLIFPPTNADYPLVLRSGFGGRVAVLHIRETATLLLTALSEGITVDDTPAPARMIRALSVGSLIRDPAGNLLYYGDLLRCFTDNDFSAAPFVFSGTDVNFRFPRSDNGLHNFTFAEQSGRLVGVMGGSGVGKSTLLSILNGSLAPDSGTVAINGIDLYRQAEQLHGVIGYVPQDDLLLEDLTVYQNLLFNARLCLAHLDEDELRGRVMATLADLNQSETRDLKVGNPLDKTISGGQRKRLNIALELIREPAVLFVDEPTSGLSSADSENVMNLLKAQAAKGKLVIVIIHQPSSSIYKMFDSLWVLDSGGYPIYTGNPVEAIRYFREAATMAGAEQLFCPQCGHVNPEQIFTIIETRSIGQDGRFTGERKYPPVFWHQRYLDSLSAVVTAAANKPAEQTPATAVHAPTRIAQTGIFLKRTLLSRLANRPYLSITLLEAPLLALLIAGISRYSGAEGYHFGDNRNLVIFYFMSVISALFLGLSVSAEEIVRDRRILQRESFLQLSWFSYISSKFLYLAAVSAVQTLLYLLVSIIILNIPGMAPRLFAILFASALFASALGLNISSAFRTAVAIYILIPVLLIPHLLLNGVVIRLDDLIPKNSGNYHTPVIADLMASRWALEALVVEQFSANAYQRRLYSAEREASRAGYLADGLIPELRSKLDFLFLKTDLPDREIKNRLYLQALRSGVRELEQKSGAASGFTDDLFTVGRLDRQAMEELKRYLEKVSTLFSSQKEAAEERLRAELEAIQAETGPDVLRRRHHNKTVVSLVRNREELDLLRLSGERLIQLSDPVYQAPDSPWGRAVYMAGEKRLGSLSLRTFTFNLAAIGAMTVALLVALYFRLLQRFMAIRWHEGRNGA
jgi:ABC-type multidrug transport system ATPase subunit